jgi:polyisoprenoid-binding protein YceI
VARAALPALVVAALLGAGAAVGAEPLVLVLDPQASAVHFELEATLHTVEGSARLERGELHFDPDTGAAAGRVVVDARSAETGIARRDSRMHDEVLQSVAYPQILFDASGLEVAERSADAARLVLRGTLTLRGEPHAVEIPARATREPDGRVRVRGVVVLPYVDWGLPDVSTFLLRVARDVTVDLDVVGRLTPAEPSAPTSR